MTVAGLTLFGDEKVSDSYTGSWNLRAGSEYQNCFFFEVIPGP